MIMLEESYRASLDVIKPSSYLFYGASLRSNVPGETNTLLDWAHARRMDLLKKLEDDGELVWCPCHNRESLACTCHRYEGFPIIFHSTSGSQEMHPDGSNSVYNLYEIELVKDYVEILLQQTGISPGEIGIISPYKYQVIF